MAISGNWVDSMWDVGEWRFVFRHLAFVLEMCLYLHVMSRFSPWLACSNAHSTYEQPFQITHLFQSDCSNDTVSVSLWTWSNIWHGLPIQNGIWISRDVCDQQKNSLSQKQGHFCSAWLSKFIAQIFFVRLSLRVSVSALLFSYLFFPLSLSFNPHRFCELRQPSKCTSGHPGHERLSDRDEEVESSVKTAEGRQPSVLTVSSTVFTARAQVRSTFSLSTAHLEVLKKS